ncbi:MAG TPA: SagB family peptide dehydrogenase [Gaiellaceae bacterium]
MRVRHAPLVRAELYGDDEPALDDPAELFHEASKLHPALRQRQAAGIVRLETNSALRAAATHAVRRNPQLPSHPLPRPLQPPCSLWSAIARRRSRRDFGGELGAAELATILDAAYGVRDEHRRTVPSGGALYPLELHVAIRSRGVHRYDPGLHALEEHDLCDPWPALERACPLPGLLENGFAAILLLAVFGRTRFKYGLRGYRFALLEAGHVAQNVVLAAAALNLPALPLGGFYDAQVDELVGADGVNESVVYAVVVGGRS